MNIHPLVAPAIMSRCERPHSKSPSIRPQRAQCEKRGCGEAGLTLATLKVTEQTEGASKCGLEFKLCSTASSTVAEPVKRGVQ